MSAISELEDVIADLQTKLAKLAKLCESSAEAINNTKIATTALNRIAVASNDDIAVTLACDALKELASR